MNAHSAEQVDTYLKDGKGSGNGSHHIQMKQELILHKAVATLQKSIK